MIMQTFYIRCSTTWKGIIIFSVLPHQESTTGKYIDPFIPYDTGETCSNVV